MSGNRQEIKDIFCKSILEHDTALLRTLLRNPFCSTRLRNLLDAIVFDGYTALQWCCLHGHIELARLLIDNGADIGSIGQYKWTALHVASFSGQYDTVKLLLSSCANPLAEDIHGCLPVSLAKDKLTHAVLLKAMRLCGKDVGRCVESSRPSQCKGLVELKQNTRPISIQSVDSASKGLGDLKQNTRPISILSVDSASKGLVDLKPNTRPISILSVDSASKGLVDLKKNTRPISILSVDSASKGLVNLKPSTRPISILSVDSAFGASDDEDNYLPTETNTDNPRLHTETLLNQGVSKLTDNRIIISGAERPRSLSEGSIFIFHTFMQSEIQTSKINLQIENRDSGVYLDPEDNENIFEKYHKFENNSKQNKLKRWQNYSDLYSASGI